MLYLTRKVGESVLINDDIEVTVVEVRGKSIKLGFTFPAGVSVLRRELFEKIQRENLEAAQADPAQEDATNDRGRVDRIPEQEAEATHPDDLVDEPAQTGYEEDPEQDREACAQRTIWSTTRVSCRRLRHSSTTSQ